MKVCILFFGLPRCSLLTIPSIEREIINPIRVSGYDVDIYSSLNYLNHVISTRSNENHELVDSNYDYFRSFRYQLHNQSNYFDTNLYNKLLKFGDSWQDKGQSLRNHLYQIYSLEKGFLAVQNSGYDIFVFVRPDLIIHGQVPILEFIKKFGHSKSVLIPNWQWWTGINDRFCVATKDSACSFATRYSKLIQNSNYRDSAVHSESDLEKLLISENVKIKTFNSKMSRVRSNGQIVNEDFDILKTTCGNRRILKSQISNIDFYEGIIDTLKVIFKILRKIVFRKCNL